jgi:GNAT superfamily N-acetyltransferase
MAGKVYREFDVMRLRLSLATEDDAEAIAAVRNAASEHLTAVFGHGHWSSGSLARSVFSNLGRSRIFVVRRGATVIATLKLGTKKPWAIDTSYFGVCAKPLYLTGMAVLPTEQRKGVGRLCMEQAVAIAQDWPADAIRLDAYDATAGAGEFYRKCGFREVGRASYRNTPLIYFELNIMRNE